MPGSPYVIVILAFSVLRAVHASIAGALSVMHLAKLAGEGTGDGGSVAGWLFGGMVGVG
jgi:hypothetical protein